MKSAQPTVSQCLKCGREFELAEYQLSLCVPIIGSELITEGHVHKWEIERLEWCPACSVTTLRSIDLFQKRLGRAWSFRVRGCLPPPPPQGYRGGNEPS